MPLTYTVSIIVLNVKGEVLLEGGSAVHSLPSVEVPKFTRLARAVTREAEVQLGFQLFCFGLAKDVGCSAQGAERLIAVTRFKKEQRLGETWRWIPRDSLEQHLSSEALAAANRGLEELDADGPFGYYGSLDDLRAWYTPLLNDRHARECRIEQWNGDRVFQLFRIICDPLEGHSDTFPRSYWFKAVGQPNTREFAVIQKLTSECPSCFAPIVGTLPSVNGWLMEDIDGYELDRAVDLRAWDLTAKALARLQIRFVGRDRELLAIGCKDWRVPQVLERVDSLFAHIAVAMEQQPSVPPPRLSKSDLTQMVHACKALCHRLLDLGIPDALAHGDFSPHNVLISNGVPVFIDWAEAYLTFPFISWEYFWNRLIKDHPEHGAWMDCLHDSYAEQWTSIVAPKIVRQALLFSPAYAVLVRSMYRTDGDIRDGLEPGTEASRRSLVRRLQRELQAVFSERHLP